MDEQNLVLPEYNKELVELLQTEDRTLRRFGVVASFGDRALSIRYRQKLTNGAVGFDRFEIRFANSLYLSTERILAKSVNTYTGSFYDESKNLIGTFHREFPGTRGNISNIFSTELEEQVTRSFENTLASLIILGSLSGVIGNESDYAITVSAKIAESLIYVLRKDYDKDRNTKESKKIPIDLLYGEAQSVINLEYSKELAIKTIERLRQPQPLSEESLLEDLEE